MHSIFCSTIINFVIHSKPCIFLSFWETLFLFADFLEDKKRASERAREREREREMPERTALAALGMKTTLTGMRLRLRRPGSSRACENCRCFSPRPRVRVPLRFHDKVSAVSSEKQIGESLLSWAKAEGAQPMDVFALKTSAEGVRGVYTRRNLEADSIICEVPRKLALEV